jgi:hypothetical protein
MKSHVSKLILVAFFVTACKSPAPSTTTVTSADGRKRSLPAPQKFIQFQGSDFTIKGVTIKLPQKGASKGSKTASPSASPTVSASASPGAGNGIEGSVAEITFGTKFRDVTDLAIILDNAQFRDAQYLIAAASTLTDDQFNKRLARISDNQQKLDQLALIVSAKDSNALQRWVDNYFKDRQIANTKPVTNTALGLKQY